MGIAMGIMQTFGILGLQSNTIDKVFDNSFDKVTNFRSFHVAFLDICSKLNTIMPGKHFRPPSFMEIEDCYKLWKDATTKEEKKKLFVELMKNHVYEAKSNDGAMVMVGMVAPAASMVLKKSGENMPQLKKFRLNLIPDIVFVPTCTMLALLGVRLLQIRAPATP